MRATVLRWCTGPRHALAIGDERQRELFLERDPYGIKPLYTANDGWTFRFALGEEARLARARPVDPLGMSGRQGASVAVELGWFGHAAEQMEANNTGLRISRHLAAREQCFDLRRLGSAVE